MSSAHQDPHASPSEGFSQSENFFLSSNNLIAIYTVLSILVKMERQLGLEAMLEYIGKYLATIDKQNPQFKSAVAQAIEMMSIEKIYKEAN